MARKKKPVFTDDEAALTDEPETPAASPTSSNEEVPTSSSSSPSTPASQERTMSKADAIRTILDRGLTSSPSEVVSIVKAEFNMDVTPAQVSGLKNKKSPDRPSTIARRTPAGVSSVSRSGTLSGGKGITLDDLEQLKEMADRLGGWEQLKEIVGFIAAW